MAAANALLKNTAARDQQQRRRAHLQANQEISRPSWPRVPDHLAADRPDRLDARGLQRGGEPEQDRRDAGANDEKQHHAPVRVGHQQSDISDLGGHAGHHRVDDRREHHARDHEAGRGGHERQQQALRQQLADDAAAGGAKRQPDANLTLSRHGPGEEKVGDVGTANQQDEAERKEQGREHEHGFKRLRDGTAPRDERDARSAALDRTAVRLAASQTASPARAVCRDRPGFRRPMMSRPTVGLAGPDGSGEPDRASRAAPNSRRGRRSVREIPRASRRRSRT